MDDLLSRIAIVLERQDFRMCVPPESDDTDIVLEECRDAIESLRQQLAAAESNIDTLTKELEVQSYWGPKWELANTERLAALAACESKQSALEQDFAWAPIGSYSKKIIAEAIAIQPDASALKAHDDALIERCAEAAEAENLGDVEREDDEAYNIAVKHCASAIRELKKEI